MSDKEITAKINFDGDSKRYHRFKVVHPEGHMVGVIYLAKEMNPMPTRIVLEMVSK